MQSESNEAQSLNRNEAQSLSRIVAEVMEIDLVQPAKSGPGDGISIHGQLRMEADVAYAHLAPQFHLLGYTIMLRQERNGVVLLALPGTIMVGESRLWLALLLFALTVVSTTFVGGRFEGDDGVMRYSLGLGLAYSAALLSILLAHEMGHFLVARRLGVGVSYPFFIPMPLLFLGTMGAFIAMKEPPPDRRALLSIGIAGPLAGLIVAIPVLFLGLHLSEVKPLVPEPNTFLEGNSLLYSAMKIAVFGRFLPSGGEDVLLHPVALAGWAGLLVTGLNLLPAGQLDGGHILFALFGPQVAQIVTWIVAAGLVAMGFIWEGWFVWALLIMLLGQRRAPLLNEVTPLDRRMQLLAILGLIVFVLVFVPRPITLIGS